MDKMNTIDLVGAPDQRRMTY